MQLVYLTCLAVGVGLGLAIRRVVDSEQADRLYRLLGDGIVLVLLPVHVFMASARAKQIQQEQALWQLMLWGAGFCLATFVLIYLACRAVPAWRTKSPHLPYIGSTFSGGGRTVLLAGLLGPLADRLGLLALLGSTNALIDALAIFDVGYWIFYVFAMQTFMRVHYKDAQAPRHSAVKWGGVFVAMVLGFIGIDFVGEGVVAWLLQHRSLLTYAIVVLAAVALMLKFEGRSASDVAGDGLVVIIGRLLAVLALFLIVRDAAPQMMLVVVLPAVLMAISPPSSLVDQMLRDAGAPIAAYQSAINLGVIWNMALIAVLIIGAVIGVIISEAASWPPPAP